jgi:sulfur-oxidizing protein SoxB
MTGALLKDILEDVGDNLFNPTPTTSKAATWSASVAWAIASIPSKAKIGSRISDMTLPEATGEPIDPPKNYVVAGWASVNEGTEGPPIWDVVVVEGHPRQQSGDRRRG